MFDLVLATVFVLALATVAFAGTARAAARAAARLGRRGAAAIGALVAVATVGGHVTLGDSVWIVWALPVSSVVILGNFVPIGLGVVGGLAWSQIEGRHAPARRASVTVLVATIALYALLEPVVGSRPAARDRWSDGVCLQTSPVSCAPAAGATLLAAHGIASSESAMIEGCLTTLDGTTLHGAYRGLARGTDGSPWTVEVVRWSVPELLADPGPVVLNVVLEPGATDDPRYERDWGWQPGQPHAVVYLGAVDERLVAIADPSVGREQWSIDDLRVLWHGEGLRLIDR